MSGQRDTGIAMVIFFSLWCCGTGLVILDLEQHQRGVQSLILRGENPRSDLSWLCMAMVLLVALFCEQERSPG
jgi:hypothetical protein